MSMRLTYVLVKAFTLGYTKMTLRRAVKAGVISEASGKCLLGNMHNSLLFLSDLKSFQSLVDKHIFRLELPTKVNSSTDK